MNENRGKKIWNFRKKIVSAALTFTIVLSGLAFLMPMSSDEAMGYIMPVDVDWNMDDLVANSSGAVTVGSPGNYYVNEEVNISLNSSLTVMSGQNIFFNSDTAFNVHGSLYAEGNNMSSVTFTSNSIDPSQGDWKGISFYGGLGSVDFASISYAENGILMDNTTLTISNCDFSHNVWGVYTLGGNCQLQGNSFFDCGILPHPDPLYSVGGGVYVGNDTYGYIDGGNVFDSNIGGIRVGTSWYFHISNNFFYNNLVYGIYLEASSDNWYQRYINIHGNEIDGNENYGIYASLGYESFIDNNNIIGNRIGIHIESLPGTMGGGGSIYNNYIAYNWEIGIECYGTAMDPTGYGLSINGNDIICNNITGIYLQGSWANIYKNDILGSYFGIYASNSTPTIQFTNVESTNYGIWANHSDVQVTDCEIVASYHFDYYLENDAYITSLNTTFDKYSVCFDDGISVLEVKWYLHVTVINASGPVPSAIVNVSDNENGSWSQKYVTNANGKVYWIEVTEYKRDLYSWIYLTPHNITATKGLEVGYAEPFMDMSKFVVIDLTPGEVPIPPGPAFNLNIALKSNDLELTWEPSPDDGGGENDVVGYMIYRADSVNGVYTNVDFVNITGLSSYNWTDPGLGDGEWNDYFYIVRAKDAEGLEDGNSNKVGKFVSYLEEGWNLISVPFLQEDITREVVLQTIEGNYTSVYGYHAGKSRPWLHWHRDKPNEFNDVIEVNHEEGYYVDMLTADYLITVGKVAPQTEIILKSGWNLVGYPCLTDKMRDDALFSITGKYNIVYYYDTAICREVRLEANDYMQVGHGFWIHATENCVWTIDN